MFTFWLPRINTAGFEWQLTAAMSSPKLSHLLFFCFNLSLSPATSAAERPNQEPGGVRRGAALGPRSGNLGAAPGRVDKAVPRGQRGGDKRKQTDSDRRGGSENEPPGKKPLACVSVRAPGKKVVKAPSRKKLIAGQGKLTSFFRL